MYALAAKGISANESIWTKMGLAVSSIRVSDFQTGDSLKEQILTDYAGDNRLPEVENLIADEYRCAGKYEVASAIYKYIIDKWPGNKILLWAKVGLARIDIAYNKEAAAQKAIDNIISEFKDHHEMPSGVFSIGEQYWQQAFSERGQAGHEQDPNGKSIPTEVNFKKALAVWKRVIKELPASHVTMDAHFFSAECYYQLGQHEEAIEYYQKVVDNWPYYEYAWHAHFLIAICFEELEESGRISKEDAAMQIIRTCERLLSDYPDCRAVEAARDLLERWNSIEIEEKN